MTQCRTISNTVKRYLPIFFFIFSNSTFTQTLDDYLIMAGENNPGLKARFGQYQAALERVPQVGSLPDPQLAFGVFVMPMERFMGTQVAEISVMQMFPWFGTLGAAKEETTLMARANYEEFSEAKSTLFYEVKATWYALYLLEKEIAISRENIQLLETLERVAINRFRSGGQTQGTNPGGQGGMNKSNPQAPGSTSAMGGMNMQVQSNAGTSASRNMTSTGEMENMSGGSMIDVLRVQMEINELNNSLALLEDSKTPLLARFNQLLNRPLEETVVIPDTIPAATMPVPLSEIPDSIRKNNPMILMLEKEEEAFLAQERMNKKMGFPMIGIGVQYDIFRPRPDGESMMNGRNMIMPMATVSIPLWRKKYNASVRESGYRKQAAFEQKQEVSNQLMVDHEEALKDFKDAQRRFILYQNQTELATQSLNILTNQYTTAGRDFEEVLRMQQQLLDYRLKKLDALVDGNITVAMLERLMGR